MAMLKGLLAAVLSLAATGAASGAGAILTSRCACTSASRRAAPPTCWPGCTPRSSARVQPDVHRGEPARRRRQYRRQALAQAPADGYTIAMAANYVAANAAMQRNPYDWGAT